MADTIYLSDCPGRNKSIDLSYLALDRAVRLAPDRAVRLALDPAVRLALEPAVRDRQGPGRLAAAAKRAPPVLS